MVAADLAPTPANFWNHHVAKQQHSLKHFSNDDIIAGLLPEVDASVCRNGVISNDIRFTCGRAETEQWFSRARRLGDWKVEARGDMGWTSDLFIRVAGESGFIPCQAMDTERLVRNRHSDDIEYLNEWKR